MAKLRLRGNIAIQKDRIMVIHPATEPVIHWCPICQRDASMVVPEEAARSWNVKVPTIYRWMDTGKIHFLEVAGGVLVCLSSTPTSGGNS